MRPFGRRDPVQRFWRELWPAPAEAVFARAHLEGLGEGARRYLEHALAPGVPLARAVELHMRGELRIGTWRRFEARERLALGRGFTWRASAGPLGLIRGWDAWVDGEGGMRWHLLGLVPVLTSSDPDTLRSAIGRALMESIWLPTAFLPAMGAEWLEGSGDEVVVARTLGGERGELRLGLAPNGALRQLTMARWFAEEGQRGRYRPFGGVVESERRFEGFTIPTVLRVGWDFGAPAFESEGEFFRGEVVRAKFR